MRYAIVNEENIIVNIIEYDGSGEVKLAVGSRLQETDALSHIGDDINSVRLASPAMDEVERKASRDQAYKQDLVMIACYNNELKLNPLLSFTQYLDDLEVLKATMNQ